jgi:hypothetical protein
MTTAAVPRRNQAVSAPLFLLAALCIMVASTTFAARPAGEPDAIISAVDSALTAIGEARDTETGQVLYREYHYRQPGSGLGSVQYRDPEHQLLSTKTLDFNHAPWAPAFQQVDLRTGELIFARWQGQTLTMGYRESQRDRLRQERIDTPQLVADAGFDSFIRARWNELVGDQPQRFEFAVPSRLDTLTLVAQRRECEASSSVETAVCFRVVPENWLFAMLVDPIDLQYAVQNRQLLSFHGLSNITDADGKPQIVTIRYRHAEPGGYLADDQAIDGLQAGSSS